MVAFFCRIIFDYFHHNKWFSVSLLKPAAVEGYLASSISLKPAKAIDPGVSASTTVYFFLNWSS